MNIPFHKPIIPSNLDKINSDSLRSGWLTTGPQVKNFEEFLSNFLNSKYVIAVNSCTAALHLALAAKGFNKGDKFIVPTYTFVATVEVGEYLGMSPILIDCDKNFNIDINQIEDQLKKDKKVKAILPVHFAGNPVDMKNIFYLSEKYDLFVLEDAAHALESFSNIGKVGDTPHAAAFSFYANKNITTLGEGGAVSTNDGMLAEKIRKLSLHGMSKDGWKRFKNNGKWAYDISELGYKYNMTDISASFGLWQSKHITDWLNKRNNIFDKYCKNLNQIDGIICPEKTVNGIGSNHLFIIRIVLDLWQINRNEIIKYLNDAGIGTSVHYIPVHMHSFYQKKYGYKPLDYPLAKQYSETVITLPLYPKLTNIELNYIIDTINNLWDKYKY